MGPIPLVFSREFKDWHLQWGNGNGWSDLDDFFGRPHVKFRKMVHIFLAIFVKRPIKSLGKIFQTPKTS